MMYGGPGSPSRLGSSPISKTLQMCGCDIAACSRASRKKRRTRAALAVGEWRSPGRMIFSATIRASRGSRALYTAPMPPAPKSSRTS